MNKDFHIVILANPLDDQKAGVHRYLDRFLAALDRKNFRVKISIIRFKSVEAYQNIHTVVMARPKNLLQKALRYFIWLPRKASSMEADMVIEMAHFGPFNLPRRVKRVVFIHDLTPLIFPQFHTWISSTLQKVFLPSIVKKADWILCNSENTKKDIEDHLNPDSNISVLRPGYDDDFYHDNSKYSKQLSHLTDREFILSVGTLEPRKNLDVLIKAFEEMKRKNWSGQLVLCGGKGWRDTALIGRINASPFKKDIVLTGYVSKDDLRRLYSNCRLFVYPSLYEGFGLPILEALSCGAKVIASSSSSMPEAGGMMAEYFDPLSAEELEDKIMKLMDLEYDREKAISFAKGYRWSETAGQFLSELEKIMSR